MEVSYIMNDTGITIVFDDGSREPVTVYKSQPHFGEVVDALKGKMYDLLVELCIPRVAFERKFESSDDRVTIEGGVVSLDGNPVEGHLCDRMVEMVNEGLDIAPLAKFLVNLHQNPSYRAVTELYGFLEASNLPITSDGHFLAYKRVRDNYMDIYTGKMDNSIGQVVSMPRNRVDEEKNRTCSVGLHFCGRGYLSSYGTASGNRTVVVKINPADVVSIPTDYNNMKGRCCRYEVVGELEHSREEQLELSRVDSRFDAPINIYGDDFEDDFEDDYYFGAGDDEYEAAMRSVEESVINALNNTLIGGVAFSSRDELREFVRNNPEYISDDRGAGATPRWVAIKRLR